MAAIKAQSAFLEPLIQPKRLEEDLLRSAESQNSPQGSFKLSHQIQVGRRHTKEAKDALKLTWLSLF